MNCDESPPYTKDTRRIEEEFLRELARINKPPSVRRNARLCALWGSSPGQEVIVGCSPRQSRLKPI